MKMGKEIRMKKNSKLLLTIIISGLSFTIGYCVNFFLTRFITENVGTDAQGYITLSKTIATYIVIATTALNSYASRYISLEYHKKNIDKANMYFSSVFGANLIAGTFFLLLTIAVIPYIGTWFTIPDVLRRDVSVLFVLVFTNLFISLLSTAFQASTYIKDKLYLTSIFRGASYFVEAACLLCLYNFLPTRILYAGIGMIAATIINFYGFLRISKKYTPELKIDLRKVNVEAIKELCISGIWNSFNGLGNTLNSGLDIVVSNALLGGVAMGQVSIVKSITNIFSNLYQMVAQPFQPRFLKAYANSDMGILIDDLKFSMKLSGLISNLAFAGIVGFGINYYQLWLPNQDVNLLYRLTIIAVATSILEGAMYPLYYIYTLTIKNKIPCIITIIGGIANVLGMIVLINHTHLGIYAIFITTAIVMNIINGITNPIYMAHCLNIKISSFYPDIAQHLFSCGIVTALVWFVAKHFKTCSWSNLIAGACISVVLGSVVHILIVFKPTEILKYVKKAFAANGTKNE